MQWRWARFAASAPMTPPRASSSDATMSLPSCPARSRPRGPGELHEKFRRPNLAEVTVEFLRAALPTPTLLVFENVHLVDEASADLLRRLADDVADRPWAVVVSRREQPTGFVADPSAGH